MVCYSKMNAWALKIMSGIFCSNNHNQHDFHHLLCKKFKQRMQVRKSTVAYCSNWSICCNTASEIRTLATTQMLEVQNGNNENNENNGIKLERLVLKKLATTTESVKSTVLERGCRLF